jgi:LEA14-like dessication related protein
MSFRVLRRPAASAAVLLGVAGCAAFPSSDPLNVSVAGIEGLPSEGMEIRLAVQVRVQNPNDAAVEYNGVALTVDVNGKKLASGVSDETGTVPRYGESVLTIPVTAPLFAMVRQGLSFLTDSTPDELRYEVKGKLEGGLFGTKRFSDTGTFNLQPPAQPAAAAP